MPKTISTFDIVIAIVITNAIIYIIFGIYLWRQAVKKEESPLLVLHKCSLNISCLGGTEFEFANLNKVDFTEADLKYARFKNAKIIDCCFQHVKNQHLALIDNLVQITLND